MYTFEDLKEDVRKEAEALRVHATKDELAELSYQHLKPTNMRMCIYGQITGSCYSLRAAKLIEKCCVRYFKHDIMPDLFSTNSNMSQLQRSVNGTTVNDFLKERTFMLTESHFSAIEAYILLPEAKNANLISYLRGETETLTL